MTDLSKSERLGKRAAEFRAALIEKMAAAYGGKPADAQPLSHAEALRLWMLPTSPAAEEAFKRGATLEEATQANAMWAQMLKQRQDQMRQGGATDQQIHDAGFSDEAIFRTTRRHAYEQGKAESRDDPEREADYHTRLARRAAAARSGASVQDDGTRIGEVP